MFHSEDNNATNLISTEWRSDSEKDFESCTVNAFHGMKELYLQASRGDDEGMAIQYCCS